MMLACRWQAAQAFAGYTILRLLGSGGMGEVYLAQHPRLPRRDALKILGNDVSADDDYRKRFIREADLAAELWHPNIVRVNDRGEFNGQLWISMDSVNGTDAASLLRDRYPAGMPADEVATIVAAIASALDYAHQRGLLHRDVKPANIFLANPEDGEQRIHLGDFGIARNMGEISGLTETNTTIGTLPYAAPEQLMDEPIDGRVDQYALAATAYHLLTGKPLFLQTNPAAVISHHLNAPPPTLADTRPELATFDPVIARALAKDPAQRFARCTDFAHAFAEATESGGHATASAPTRAAPLAARPPESTAVPSAQADTDKQKRRRRRRIIVVAAAIAVVTFTAIGVIGYMIQPKKHTPSTPATGTPTPPAANSTAPIAWTTTMRSKHKMVHPTPHPTPTTPGGWKVAEGSGKVDALPPSSLESWLSGNQPWPFVPTNSAAADEFFETASEFRKRKQRNGMRPEIQEIGVLRDAVASAIDGPGTLNRVADAKVMADYLRDQLARVDAYVTLLADHLEKNGYASRQT